MKEKVIKIPNNFELKEIKDDKIIFVEKDKKVTYDDIIKELFPFGKIHYYIADDGNILDSHNRETTYNCKNNAISKKQLEKLLAINTLMNVAKYLNDNWQPNWDDEKESKFFIPYNYVNNEIKVDFDVIFQNNYVYFKSEELAKKAIEILGEETIKLALCTDY